MTGKEEIRIRIDDENMRDKVDYSIDTIFNEKSKSTSYDGLEAPSEINGNANLVLSQFI